MPNKAVKKKPAKKKPAKKKTVDKPMYFWYYIYIDGTEQRDMWDHDTEGKKGNYVKKILDKKYNVDYDDIHNGYVLINFKPSNNIPKSINIPLKSEHKTLFNAKKCVLKKGNQFIF